MNFIEKYMERKIRRVSWLLMSAEKKDEHFAPKHYTMKKLYEAENLIIGNLEYVSSEANDCGPFCVTSEQTYIFEPIVVGDEIKYQEVFTGFIAGDQSKYFDLPYVVNAQKLTDLADKYKDVKIPKLGMLILLDEVEKMVTKNKEKEKRYQA